MRAFQVRRFGPPENLELRELPDPMPGPGEVVLRVRAIGLNFADCMARQGVYPRVPRPPFVPGMEVTGEVLTAGGRVLCVTALADSVKLAQQRAYEVARGIVFDQPHVVEGAGPSLAAAGVEGRCTIAGGSFLESVPSGGDVYVMKHVLHNWDDDDCVTILRSCRAAMGPKSTLLVLENVMPEDDLTGAASIVMLDLHMMAVLGGRERTEREYAELMARAGLSFTRCIATREGAPDIVEAVLPA